MHFATRLLLAVAIVMAAGQTGAVHAATQTGDDARTRERHPHGKAGAADGPENVQPAKRPGKADPHKPGEHTGNTAAEAAKLRGAKSQATEQKGHTAAPVAVVPSAPKPPKEPTAKEPTGPPPKLPRFVALKTDDTNMRKGPGQRYPIEWVYKRRDLPVEVEREYDVWRYVRDQDGIEGWVHQVTLSDRRTFLITDKDAILRADASDTSGVVALLKVGVIGRLRECAEGSKWCQVQAGGYKGYLRRDQFWGLLPDEVVSPS